MGINNSRESSVTTENDGSSKKSKPRMKNTSSISTATTSSNAEKKSSMHQPKMINGRTYHGIESSVYMLPRDDREIDRLHDEHFVTKELLGL